LRPIFERVFGPFEDRHWDHLHMLIRKSGHFVGYGLVCFAFLRAWLLTLGRGANLSAGRWRAQSVGYALAATFLVAGSDEWHQTFLPGRTGQFSDVLLDTVGGAVVCGLVWVRFWRGRSPQS
jgi:VanZ family protein